MPYQTIPRPEHPRPDWHRGAREGRDWINLNGTWDFDFDPQDVGEVEGRQTPGSHAYSDQIVAPCAPGPNCVGRWTWTFPAA